MEAKQRQEQLDKISQEDLEKVKAYQASTRGAYPVDQEWLILAEWLRIAGYQAYLDARDDARIDPETGERGNKGNLIITMPEILTIIEANRKLEAKEVFEDMQSSFVGAVSAQTKKPASTFKSLTKNIIRRTKVDE